MKVKNMVNLMKYNFHWKEGYSYGFPKKRELFDTLVKHIDISQIIGLVGLRRTGKTVLLKQLMDHLMQRGHPRDRMIYYSFDDETSSLDDLFQDYRVRIGIDLDKAGKVYVFLDEIQKLDNWQNLVKYYYDTYSNVKFFISGSSSLFLKKKAEESLAGRIFLFTLPVLSFREFLLFKGEEGLLKSPEMFREELFHQTELYIIRQLPEIITAQEDFIKMYVESIIRKIIFEDLPKVFPIEYADALMRIMKIVANNPGIVTDYDSLSNDLGMNRKTLSNYVSYLEMGYLIHKIYNFSENRLTSEKKMKRLYVNNTTFIHNLSDTRDNGRVIENLIVNAGEAKFFWRKNNHEVDVILEQSGSPLPVESKYRGNIQDKDLKGLIAFMDGFDIAHGIVVTKDMDIEKEINGRRITFIPLWKWLLAVPNT